MSLVVSNNITYNYLKRLLKHIPFLTAYLYNTIFSSYTTTKTTCHDRLNAEVYVKIHCFLLSQVLKRYEKNVKKPPKSLKFLFWKVQFFCLLKMLFMLYPFQFEDYALFKKMKGLIQLSQEVTYITQQYMAQAWQSDCQDGFKFWLYHLLVLLCSTIIQPFYASIPHISDRYCTSYLMRIKWQHLLNS